MVRKLRLPSPAMCVALLALVVASTGTAIAADVVPLAKRALSADKAKTANTAKVANTAKTANNAKKLNGQTASQIASIPGPATDAQTLTGQTAAQIAATPGPATSLPAGTITYRTQTFSVDAEKATARDTARCLSDEKAIGGGWEQSSGLADVITDRPMPDGSGWRFHIYAESGNELPAIGTIYAVCLKVS